ncbi:MAG: hypothetical protein WC866_04175 [Patescibacteria group bacterium]|jgi:hypothetical protein
MKRRIIALAAFVLSAGLFLPGAASALTFSPPTFDVSAKPGQILSQTLKLRNESTLPVTFRASTASFAGKPGDETSGVPDFYPSNEARDGHGLGAWISFTTAEFTLLPGERAELPFTITVPKEAGPGSYFGAVILGTKAGETSENVGITGTAAALVLLKVEGEIVEALKVDDFSAPSLSTSLPVRFEALITNNGTVHERPYGEVIVRNVFGQEVAVLAMNRAEYKSVLPSMSRRYSTAWQRRALEKDASILTRQWRNFAFGFYTAEMRLRYGEDGRILSSMTRFWVIPWLTLLIFIGGGAALIWSLRRLLAWYQDRIIRRHEKGI